MGESEPRTEELNLSGVDVRVATVEEGRAIQEILQNELRTARENERQARAKYDDLMEKWGNTLKTEKTTFGYETTGDDALKELAKAAGQEISTALRRQALLDGMLADLHYSIDEIQFKANSKK